eukprot:CAMPEP_0174253216 /NCGR_PEP_ID=MMETSP0439-20130205/2596_1 /TAXON_ID=0 /ORGANISM="Stereomyxa ramosa, Strain Chinc5" /LENGTH=877 /DNA_ID=CAMNT_0015334125 /DNA_START=65 /DNA_END=2694 /DNA_ORIENTATION=-
MTDKFEFFLQEFCLRRNRAAIHSASGEIEAKLRRAFENRQLDLIRMLEAEKEILEGIKNNDYSSLISTYRAEGYNWDQPDEENEQPSTHFSNFHANISRNVGKSIAPSTADEISEFILEAKEAERRVRGVGGGHSYSNIFFDDSDYLISSNNLRGINIEKKFESGKVWLKIGAGETTLNVTKFLTSNSLELPCNLYPHSFMFGGCAATGAHGTGWNAGTLSDYIVSMEIIDSNGKLQTYSYDDTPDLMPAVIYNLGLFGIIFTVTVEVKQSRFNYKTVDKKVVMEDLIPENGNCEDLINLIPNHYSIQMFWYGFNNYKSGWNPWEDDMLLLKVVDRTKDQPTEQQELSSYQQKVDTGFLVENGLLTKTFINAVMPVDLKLACSLIAQSTRGLVRGLPTGARVGGLSSTLHQHYCDDNVKTRAIQVALPLLRNFSNFIQAWNAVAETARSWVKEKKEMPCDLTLAARFMKNSAALLSPAYSKDPDQHFCVLEMSCSVLLQHNWDEFSAEIATEWLKIPGARFDWTKELEQCGDFKEVAMERWGRNIGKFKELLFESKSDVHGIFRNNWLSYIFEFENLEEEEEEENLFTSHSRLVTNQYPETTFVPLKKANFHTLRSMVRKNASILSSLNKFHEKDINKLIKAHERERTAAFESFNKEFYQKTTKKDKELEKDMKDKAKIIKEKHSVVADEKQRKKQIDLEKGQLLSEKETQLDKFKDEVMQQFAEDKTKLIAKQLKVKTEKESRHLLEFCDKKEELLANFQELELAILEKEHQAQKGLFMRNNESECKKNIKLRKRELKKLKKQQKKEELKKIIAEEDDAKLFRLRKFEEKQKQELERTKSEHELQRAFLKDERDVKIKHMELTQVSERERSFNQVS